MVQKAKLTSALKDTLNAYLHQGKIFSIPAWCSYSHKLMTFLNTSHICKNINFDTLLTYCVFRILLQASKIATDLCVIKSSTCKGLICLVTFLWHFKELWTLDTCTVSTMLLSVLTLVVHKTSKSDKMSSLSLPPFIKSTPLVRELWFGVKLLQSGVRIQFHIAILTFKSYLSQHKTPLCTLYI